MCAAASEAEMWAAVISGSEEGGDGGVGIVLIARMGARNSVVKSASVADCRIAAFEAGRVVLREALEASSQRRETPFSRRALVTGGRIVASAASSMRRVSTALQAAA